MNDNLKIKETILSNLQLYKVLEGLEEVPYTLTGGAVVDIFYKEQPKDWDFINEKSLREFLDNSSEAKYEYGTENSLTYTFMGEKVQLIGESTRPFRIHSGEIRNRRASIPSVKPGRFIKEVKNICTISYNHKRLIPNKRAQVDEGLFVCLNKWIQKGYYINEVDYQNALSTMIKNLTGVKSKRNYT